MRRRQAATMETRKNITPVRDIAKGERREQENKKGSKRGWEDDTEQTTVDTQNTRSRSELSRASKDYTSRESGRQAYTTDSWKASETGLHLKPTRNAQFRDNSCHIQDFPPVTLPCDGTICSLPIPSSLSPRTQTLMHSVLLTHMYINRVICPWK